MTITPTTVRVPVSFPLYMRTASGEFVEVALIEDMVDVTVSTQSHTAQFVREAWLENMRQEMEAHKDENLNDEPNAWEPDDPWREPKPKDL